VRWLSRVVSIALIIVVIIGALSLLRTKMPATHVGGHFHTYAMFRDASRLATGSPVMIAGVRIGEVNRLTVEPPFARVDMVLRDDTNIPVDSWITKRAESAFGDSYLEIIPTGGEGAAPARKLKDGEPIVHVIEGGSTDTVLRSIARTMPKIDNGLNAMHDFALDSRKWVSGPLEDRLTGAERWVNEGHVEAPLEAADRAMERFESGANRAGDAIAGARPDVNKTFDRIDNGITGARKQMATIKTGIHDGLQGARDGVDRIDPTLQQMEDVVVAINEARGSGAAARFGKLVNDPELADTIEDVTEAGRDATAGLQPFKSYVGLRGEVDVISHQTRAYVTAEIDARHDKFYVIEGEKSGEGAFPEDQLSEVPTTAQYNRYQVIREGIRFTFQFGKRFGPLSLRGGIKSSTVGVGADFLVGDGRLKLSADVFGGYTATPRVKLAAALQVFRTIYVVGGVDDVLTKGTNLAIETGNTNVPTYFESVRYGRDYFLGASLQFSEIELATMLRIYGAMIVALLL
jgi:phospholipid/cholesterol/gamma-HCH transport system substrate-binding protein